MRVFADQDMAALRFPMYIGMAPSTEREKPRRLNPAARNTDTGNELVDSCPSPEVDELEPVLQGESTVMFILVKQRRIGGIGLHTGHAFPSDRIAVV